MCPIFHWTKGKLYAKDEKENMTEKSTSQSTNLQADMTDWTADHPTTDQRMDMIGKKVTL